MDESRHDETIYVIGEDPAWRENTAEILSWAGHGVSSLSSGTGGLSGAPIRTPGLFLINVTSFTREEFATKRSYWSGFDLPLVFIISPSDIDLLDVLSRITPYSILVSPVHEEQLLVTVRSILRHHSFSMSAVGREVDASISDYERSKVELSLKDSEARYREMFNRISSGVAVYKAIDDGSDFIFLDFNPAGQRIERINREDVIGRRVTQVFPGVREFGILEVFSRVWRTGKSEYHPISHYEDKRIAGWRENFIYRLPSGEIVAIYDDITERKQTEERIMLALKEKDILLREVHHRVKNNLQVIISLLSMQSARAGDESTVKTLSEIRHRVFSMALIHEKLYQSDNFARIDLSSYVNTLIKNLIQSFQQVQVDPTIYIMDINLDINLAIPIGFIINELITNSLKHAIAHGEEGSILIRCNKLEEQMVHLSLSDSGPGFPHDFLERDSLGLKLVQMMVQQLEGEISFSPGPGAHVEISFSVMRGTS